MCFPFKVLLLRSLCQSHCKYLARRKKIELTGIIDIIFQRIRAFHWSRHIPRSVAPADDDNTWLCLEKHPNQIKSRNRCCSELNTFQRLVSKDIMALFILHVSRPTQPLPLPQTTYEGWCGGWLWNGLNSLASLTLEMKLLFFRHPSLSSSLNLFTNLYSSFPLPSSSLRLCLVSSGWCLSAAVQTLPDAERWNYTQVKLAPGRISYLEQLLVYAQLFFFLSPFWQKHRRNKTACIRNIQA